MSGSITHTRVTGAPADSTALVDGPAWDAGHTFNLTPSDVGLGNVPNTDTSNATNVQYTAPYTGAVSQSQSSYNAQRVSVIDFGADPAYGADATTAFQSAMTAASLLGKKVFAPAGTYKIGGTVTVGGNGTCLEGEGIFSTILKSPNASNPVISVGNGLESIRLSGFQINRTVTATSGGDGIQWALTGISDGFLDNIWVRNCYIGFHLGPSALSWAALLRAEGNVSHGFLWTNNAAWSGSQWVSTNFYSGNNGGDGYAVRSDASAVAGMGTENLTNFFTFGNSGHGLSAIGTPSSPINSIRLFAPFMGQDGASEVYLDTHGGDHQINGGQLELAGTGLTGPTNSTAASNVGHGIEVTGNNIDVLSNGVLVTGMSQSGYSVAPTSMMTINGGASNFNSAYGITATDGSKVAVSGTWINGNTLGATFASTNASSMQLAGCTPTSINNMIGKINGGTAMTTDTNQLVSGVKGFLSGTFELYGGTSGFLVVSPPLVSGGAWAFPNPAAGSDTLVGNATTATLTNKTISGASNTLSVRIANDVTGLGTGIASALGANTGSAGAPVLFNGALGTPTSGAGTNLTGTAASLTAGNVTTNANLTGDVTSVGNATTLTNAPVIAKVLTGYTSGAGTVSATDSILSAIQKIDGNDALKLPLAGGSMSGNIAFSPTTAGITGTTTNDSATAGTVGEYISSTIASGSAVSLTSGTPVNVTSISLTAGDWDVWFEATLGGSGTTAVTGVIASISQTTGALDVNPGNFSSQSYDGLNVFGNVPGVGAVTLNVGPARKSLSGTTTIFAVVDEIFSVSTANAYGLLRARRVR